MKRLLITAVLCTAVWAARGEWYSFSAITSNDPAGFAPSAGETQLYLGISPLSDGQASFVFTNTGPAQSSVSQIYFDFAPALHLGLEAINNGPGVDFEVPHRDQENLPGGKTLENRFLSDLGISADNPAPFNGINPDEGLELRMSYNGAYDLFDAIENEELRIGLHVQSFAGGYSESFVNTRAHLDTIPEPGTLSILLAGGFVLRWIRRLL
jgi:hypothetical protein